MSVFMRRAFIGPIAVLLLLAACKGATTSPTAGPLDDQLAFAGTLTVCIDIPYPPQEFFDQAGNPTGSDVDIAAEIAKRNNLDFKVENSVFSTIIEAVTGGKCDIIVSAQNITTDRLKQVNMIPYFQAGQAFVVAKGNPAGIHTELDLCGKKAAAETGTTEVDYVNGTGDYAGAGLNKKCTDAGKAPVTMNEFEKDTDALLALSAGQVEAYFADSPVAGYYTVQQPAQFELSGVTVEIAQEGISVPQDKEKLGNAVVTALKAMMTDGKYIEILTKYGVLDGKVDSSAVKLVKGS
jgi:polar amino acid transport system substrate-binding protein